MRVAIQVQNWLGNDELALFQKLKCKVLYNERGQ